MVYIFVQEAKHYLGHRCGISDNKYIEKYRKTAQKVTTETSLFSFS